MRKQKTDYHFTCKNETDFELMLTMKATGGVVNMIFQKAKEKLASDKNLKVGGSLEVIKSFKVDPRFHNYVRVVMKKQHNSIVKDVKKDGINILSSTIDYVRFTKDDSNDWCIEIVYKGLYQDNR